MSPVRGKRTSLDPETLRPRARHQRSARRRRRRHGAVVAFVAVAAISVFAGLGGGAAVFAYGSSCDLSALRPVALGPNTFVYAANARLLGAASTAGSSITAASTSRGSSAQQSPTFGPVVWSREARPSRSSSCVT